ncbi:MAG: hypothetical protein ACW972_04670 [Promethearchaeota archaeon]|jgi:hypothetical protein
MVEIAKNMKILLVINAIIGILIAFLYLVVPHAYLFLVQWPFYDPYYSWIFGGTFLILSIFALLARKRKEWEQIKMIYEFIITWQLMILVLNIISLIFIPAPIISIVTTLGYNIVLIMLIATNLYYYNKAR